MGGYAHGGVASFLALETFFDTVLQEQRDFCSPETPPRSPERQHGESIKPPSGSGFRAWGPRLPAVNLVGKDALTWFT